jgi:hypothetical protein
MCMCIYAYVYLCTRFSLPKEAFEQQETTALWGAHVARKRHTEEIIKKSKDLRFSPRLPRAYKNGQAWMF